MDGGRIGWTGDELWVGRTNNLKQAKCEGEGSRDIRGGEEGRRVFVGCGWVEGSAKVEGVLKSHNGLGTLDLKSI